MACCLVRIENQISIIVHRRRAGRCEVKMHAWVTPEPLLVVAILAESNSAATHVEGDETRLPGSDDSGVQSERRAPSPTLGYDRTR